MTFICVFSTIRLNERTKWHVLLRISKRKLCSNVRYRTNTQG